MSSEYSRGKRAVDAETVSRVRQLLDEASRLPPEARADLIERLIVGLYQSEREIRALWLAEVQDRLAAFDRGEMAELTEEEFFAELDESDPEVDAQVVAEAEDRYRACQNGEMDAIPAQEVFRRLGER